MIILKWYSIIFLISSLSLANNDYIKKEKYLTFVIANLMIIPIIIYVILK